MTNPETPRGSAAWAVIALVAIPVVLFLLLAVMSK